MLSHKIQRYNEDIKRELSCVLRNLKDPRLDSNLLSIVNVKTSADLSHSLVLISSIDGLKISQAAVDILNSASGHIRKELGYHVKLRCIPKFTFVATDSIEYAANISKMLDKFKNSSMDSNISNINLTEDPN